VPNFIKFVFETDILSVIYIGKILLFLPFAALACLHDLRSRTVPNSVWVIAAAAMFPMIVIEAAVFGIHVLFNNAAAGFLMFLWMFVCFRFKIFGGADCKAFILIAFFFPPDLLSFVSFIFFGSFTSTGYVASGFPSFVYSPVVYSPAVYTPAIYSLIFDLISSVPVSAFMNSLLAAAVFSLFRLLWDFKNGSASLVKWLGVEMPFMLPLFVGFVTAVLFGNFVFKLISLILLSVFYF